MSKTARAALREKGEITIPKSIRKIIKIEPGQGLNFLPLGEEAVLLTPKRLELEDARRQIQRILRETKVSPEKVLKGLSESREEIFTEVYGSKLNAKKRP
jgi:AbrB family looped-hinge helix DNA binding protein